MNAVVLETLVDRVLPAVVRLRHRLHRHPELARREFETAAAIRRHLAPLDLEVLRPFLETDVVALLRGTASVLSWLRRSFAGSVRFVFQPGEEVVAAGRAVALRLFGRRGWAEIPEPSMAGEDFAYYLQGRPALDLLGPQPPA
jgi:metal-dependent amidase/aminoacylase/carboxypeptidase family protein